MSVSTNNFSLNDAAKWYNKFIKQYTKVDDASFNKIPLAKRWRLNTETLTYQSPDELTEFIQGLYYSLFLLGEALVVATRQLAAENMDEFSEVTISDLAEEISDRLINEAFRALEKAETEIFKPANRGSSKPDNESKTDATDLTKGLSDEQLAVLKKIVESEELKRWKEKNGKKDF